MTPHNSSRAVQDLYPDDVAQCYGCGRSNAEGLQLKSRPEGDEVVAHFTPRTEHVAVPGFVYGGLIASLIDCHSMATASADAERRAGRGLGDGPAPRFVTASLRVEYLHPTPLGPELELRAHVTNAGERKSVVETTVIAQGVITARGEVVAVRMPEAMTKPPTR